MRYELRNHSFNVIIETMGAEIKSIKRISDGREYMWDANPEFWAKTSPLLFPVIGRIKEGRYTVGDKSYEMVKHGFGQRTEFDVIEVREDEISLQIVSNEDKKKCYPFDFRLVVNYKLTDNELIENWKIYNEGMDTMYFAIGAHPAFSCSDRTTKEIVFHFEEGRRENNLVVKHLDENGLVVPDERSYQLVDNRLAIAKETFEQDAIVFENQGIVGLGLAEDGKEYVTIKSDAGCWGIWTHSDSNAGYVCLEPWFGYNDNNYSDKDISKKRNYVNLISKGCYIQEIKYEMN